MNLELNFINPFLLFLLGTAVLYFSSELIINHAIIIADNLNISKLFVGVIILALGTSLPELFVSILAVMKGNEVIVIGNIIGSNIANVGLVLGLSILFKPILLKNKNDYKFSLIFLLIITFFFTYFLFNNNLSGKEGLILFLFCILYFIILIKYFSNAVKIEKQSYKDTIKSFLFLSLGFLLLYTGSDIFVSGALGISHKLGINDVAIGMTIISIGTSAPELFTTFLAVKKKEENLAIGNIIGSNIINIVLVGGLISMFKNISFQFSEICIHTYIFIAISILFTILFYFLKKINRIIGLIFICIYLFFILINFYNIN